jgi:hypothetical protein
VERTQGKDISVEDVKGLFLSFLDGWCWISLPWYLTIDSFFLRMLNKVLESFVITAVQWK